MYQLQLQLFKGVIRIIYILMTINYQITITNLIGTVTLPPFVPTELYDATALQLFEDGQVIKSFKYSSMCYVASIDSVCK